MCDLDRLTRYARRVSPRHGEDALQDVLARLGPEADGPLLCCATARRSRSLARSDRRRSRRERIVGLRRGVETRDASCTDLTLDDYLTPLPRRVRAVVRRVMLGETQAAVAKRLGLHQATVSRLFAAGIRILRERLSPL